MISLEPALKADPGGSVTQSLWQLLTLPGQLLADRNRIAAAHATILTLGAVGFTLGRLRPLRVSR